MADYAEAMIPLLARLEQAPLYRPHPNPTFENPSFHEAAARILIVRLSPFRDVERSTPHLVLADAVRRCRPNAYLDLAFFPPRRDARLLADANLPLLTGIQSCRSSDDFDLVLLSNSYVLELINVPFLFHRSGIPLWASQRDGRWPPFLLGGSNAFASQALVRPNADSLVDAIFFGEVEGVVAPLLDSLLPAPASAGAVPGGPEDRALARRTRLQTAAARVEGLWVTGAWPDKPIRKAILRDPASVPAPARYPILNGEEASTARLQIGFGCPAFCSFCFEGYERKPCRDLPLPALLERARELKRETGCRHLELQSFNVNTHPDFVPALIELNGLFDSVGFKSQRVDILSGDPALVAAEVSAGKVSFSLGIEGISARQRAFLGKTLDTGQIEGVLDRLRRENIREIKLFFVLSGHEEPADFAEFDAFCGALRRRWRIGTSAPRVIFSFGLLTRMPNTPLQYDRLFLEEADWKGGPQNAADLCARHGFECRLATPWPDYWVGQVMAMGGWWLADHLVPLATAGASFDGRIDLDFFRRFRTSLAEAGLPDAGFAGRKPADYVFPFSFVDTGIPPAFLRRQFENALAFQDPGYCLGGKCLACGACRTPDERQRLIGRRRVTAVRRDQVSALGRMTADKRALREVHIRCRLAPFFFGVHPEWAAAAVMRAILRACPALGRNLLAVREALFTAAPNERRYPMLAGETVFSLKAWHAEDVLEILDRDLSRDGVRFVGQASGFRPGIFQGAVVKIAAPSAGPDPSSALQKALREERVPFTLRKSGPTATLEVTDASCGKRLLSHGEYRVADGVFEARLAIGPRLHLARVIGALGPEARAIVETLRC